MTGENLTNLIHEEAAAAPGKLTRAGEILRNVEAMFANLLTALGIDVGHFYFCSLILLIVVLALMKRTKNIARFVYWGLAAFIVVILMAMVL